METDERTIRLNVPQTEVGSKSSAAIAHIMRYVERPDRYCGDDLLEETVATEITTRSRDVVFDHVFKKVITTIVTRPRPLDDVT